jgi:hypothetical protein
MKPCFQIVLLAAPLLGIGCASQNSQLALIPQNPFGHQPAATITAGPPSLAPAALEVAARVDRVGTQIREANKRTLGFKPNWYTIGVQQPEVFHRGTDQVFITEALVKQCVTDGQLAAVLCMELGKMRAETELLAGADILERNPPMQVSVGGDFGSRGPPDLLRQAELGKYDEQRRERLATMGPPDPVALGRRYLTCAGFSPAEIEAVAPILANANQNGAMAKQLNAPAPPVPQAPPAIQQPPATPQAPAKLQAPAGG